MSNGSSRQPIRLLLVDAHQVMRHALRLLLEQQPGLTVVGAAGSRAEALEQAALVRPDVVVLELDLGDESGLDLIADLRGLLPEAPILVLTGLREASQHRQAVILGAVGLVLKAQPLEALVQAIERVHQGQAWLDPGLVATVVGELSRARGAPANPELAKIATLTERERRVIALVCEGLQNRAIAQRLALSETTVRHHLTSIFAKLEVDHRLELLIYAFRNGLAALP